MNLDPIPHAAADDPHPHYRLLRDEHPVLYLPERDLWVLSRHEDILAAIKDPDTYSSAGGVVPSGFTPEKPTPCWIRPSTRACARP